MMLRDEAEAALVGAIFAAFFWYAVFEWWLG